MFAERLDSLSNYQLYISIPSDQGIYLNLKDNKVLQMRTFPLTGNGNTNFTLTSFSFPDHLAKRFDFQYTTINNEYIQCKIPLDSSPSDFKVYNSKTSLPSLDDFSQILCRACGHPLMQSQQEKSIERILELPSEYWVELSELWVCHGAQNFQHFPRDPITAKLGHCLVSSTYIMLPQEHILEDHIEHRVTETEEEILLKREYELIVCVNCSSPVGLSNLSHMTEATHKNKNITYKLFRHAIKDKNSSFFASDSLQSKLAFDLFSLIKARSCYRVWVFGYSSVFYLQLQILSWNTNIMLPSEEDPNHLEASPIIKILFRVVKQQLTQREIITMIQRHGGKTEELIAPDVECNSLVDLLQENSLKFPSTIRNAFPDEMTLSFLHFTTK